jgi:3-keto-disaccharide hydrolase
MRLQLLVLGVVTLLCTGSTFAAEPRAAERPRELFNGKDLSGWDGNPKLWSVEDGAIVGRTTADAPIDKNTFLIWRDGEPSDFLLKLQYQVKDGNSGVQYRSHVVDPAKWSVGGYQADIVAAPTYTGLLYEEQGRGILAERGQKVTIAADGKRTKETFADKAELQKSIHDDDWNEYVIEARGERLRQWINGKLMSELTDAERGKRAKKGILALQLHVGGPMTVRFRKIELQPLKADSPDYVPKP